MPTTEHSLSPQPTPTDHAALRSRGIQRAALVAIVTNAVLAVSQIIIGLFANAFSLVADAAHTFSDLVTDLLVLVAGRHGADPADNDHPYGHGRIETITSLLLGAVLTAVGIGFLLSSGIRLQNMHDLPALHPAALIVAVITLFAKEGLFRYTLAASRRLKAPILEANAWHARSDAASSLVVAVGIGGSLSGYPFLEPLAAAVVGFLIMHMGIKLGWKAVRELIDTGLPAEDVARLRQTIVTTPGVIGLHELRTRRMADRVLCDAHVQVDPRITVSEGHHISDNVYIAVRSAHPEVKDVLVHIDPEDDDAVPSVALGALPERRTIAADLQTLIGTHGPTPNRTQVHYLGQRIEVDAFFTANDAPAALDALKRRTETWMRAHPHYRRISFFVEIAPH
jgi:cation diffusion facilitator family transporter